MLFVGFAWHGFVATPMERWDEATNVSVVAETAANSDYWNLSYQGKPFWEKPPLYYWLNVGLAKLTNTGDRFQPEGLDKAQLLVQLRLVSALSALAVMSLTIVYLRRAGFGRAYLAPLLFLIIPALWFMNPANTFSSHNFLSADSDALQMLFIMLGILAAQSVSEKASGKRLVLVGAASGLAFMTKGIFGTLPIIYLGISLLSAPSNSKKTLVRKLIVLLQAAIVFLLVAAPWHLFMIGSFGSRFVDEYFIYHQLARGATALEGHSASIFYHLILQLNPLYSGQLFVLIVVFALSYKRMRLFPERYRALLPIVLLYAITLILISIVQTKLSWYGIYLYPLGVITTYGLIKNYHHNA